MPFVSVPGARIHVRRHSVGRATPVLLIHGALATGDSEWGAVTRLIARDREVIVPDCPGHGRSTQAEPGYEFSTLADQLAALLGRLEIASVDVVGHSNGGNVALMMLVRHPNLIRSAVLQAANGHVSPDLRKLAEESPDCLGQEAQQRLARLHDRWQGPGSWRRLFHLTMRETSRRPVLRGTTLQGIDRPTLLIEGVADVANASAGHAAWLAQAIPESELWQPASGHAPHDEIPTAWFDRVERFWRERGHPVGRAVWRMSRSIEARVAPAEVRLVEDATGPHLEGYVTDAAQQVELTETLAGTGVRIAVRVLTESASGVMAVRPVVDVREGHSDSSPRATQMLCGETALLLSTVDGWSLVRIDVDGYVGWVRPGSLEPAPSDVGRGCRAHVVSDHALVYARQRGARIIGRVSFGTRLAIDVKSGDRSAVNIPGQGRGWLATSDVLEVDPSGSPYLDVCAAAARFKGFVGVPYLWGGRTPFGFDCSGLTQAFWASLGVRIPRDADQQQRVLRPVDSLRVGDVLFFASDSGLRADHVGIWLGKGRFLHASGAAGTVRINSLARTSADFDERLAGWLIEGRRPS